MIKIKARVLNPRLLVIPLIIALAFSLFPVQAGIGAALPTITIAAAQTPEASTADYVVDGIDDDVQWQQAVDALISTGGKIEDLCGITYSFSTTVILPRDSITIEGAGSASYFENDGATALFSAGAHSNVLFKDFRTDGGNVTRDNTKDSYAQNVWIGSDYVFEGPTGLAGGGGGGGSIQHAFNTIDAPTGTDPVAVGNATLTLTAGDGMTITGTAATDTVDWQVDWEDANDLNAAGDVTNDSHAHTGATLSGIDISSDTNLSATGNITLTDDQLSWSAALTDLVDVSVTNTSGDLLYGNGTEWTDLAIGTNDQVLKVSGGVPTWGTDNTGGGGGGSIQHAFNTINAPAGTDPVAAGNATLSLTAGDGMTITGTAANDTVAWEVDWEDANDLDVSGDVINDSHDHTGGTLSGIAASDVEVTEVGTATYDDVQDFINIYGSRGLISGGEITDNGNGTVDVAAGTAWLRVSDTALASLPFSDFDAKVNLALTDELTNYIYVDYNSGAPLVAATTSFAVIANDTRALVGITFRDGNEIHITHLDGLSTDIASKNNLQSFERFGISRASGLNISSGNRTVVITPGTIWGGSHRTTSAGFDTSGADVFTAWYTDDSATTWTKVANQTEIDNTQYNDITSGLSTLTAARRGVHWVYVDFDGADLNVLYGQGDYTANQAEEAGVPSVVPPILANYGVLVGKIIILKNAATMEALSPFDTTFTSSLATDHGSLAGLGDDDHSHYVLNTGDTATGSYDFTGAFFLGTFPMYFEGVSVDNTWSRFTFTDPTGNNTITFPDASGEVSLLGQSITLDTETTGPFVGTITNSGGHITIGGVGGANATATVNHTPVDRFFPEIFAASITGNSSTSIGSAEVISFDGVELTVVEIIGGDSKASFHLRTPPDFGFGGNTSVEVSYGWRTVDGSSGGVTFATRSATTLTALKAAPWVTSAADPWTANDEIAWTEYKTITPAGISTGEQDLYFTVDFVSENCDATNIYWDKFIAKGKGV